MKLLYEYNIEIVLSYYDVEKYKLKKTLIYPINAPLQSNQYL